jgi:hypothetical protein
MSLDPRDQTSIRIVAQMDETLCHEKARKDNLNPGDRHLLRLEKAKPLRVYDYADLNVPMLARIFDRRCRGYASLGYTMLLPASAVPGWPIEVPFSSTSSVTNVTAFRTSRLTTHSGDA